VLEAIALDEFKRGHLSRVELRPAARLRDARETRRIPDGTRRVRYLHTRRS
jgi:hypothetical protein